jgi:membrane protease YdiL (CAAX protease family)
MVLAVYVGLTLLRGFSYSRRPARCQLKAPTLWRGLMIFAWAQGAQSAIVSLYWNDPHGPFGFLVHTHSLTPMLVALLLVFAFREGPRDRPVAALFYCPPDARSRRWLWLLGLASTGVLMLAWRLLWPLFHHFGLAPGWWESFREAELFGSPGEAAFQFLSGAVFAPIGEELLFRGVLFGALARKMSVKKAAFISSLFFAVIHGYGMLGTLFIALSGYLWARIAARTGTLAPSLIGHSAMNILIGVGRLLLRP